MSDLISISARTCQPLSEACLPTARCPGAPDLGHCPLQGVLSAQRRCHALQQCRQWAQQAVRAPIPVFQLFCCCTGCQFVCCYAFVLASWQLCRSSAPALPSSRQAAPAAMHDCHHHRPLVEAHTAMSQRRDARANAMSQHNVPNTASIGCGTCQHSGTTGPGCSKQQKLLCAHAAQAANSCVQGASGQQTVGC